MTIDDLIEVLNEGDLSKVEETLSKEENWELVTKTYEIDRDGGGSCKFTGFFIIMNDMSDSGFNYEILDWMVAHGANVNDQYILIDPDGTMDIYPLTKYFRDNVQVLEWLLKNGADPNGVEYIQYSNGLVADVSTLAWAIQDKLTDSVEVLLKYGADPSKPSHPYAQKGYKLQKLPPMYYATMDAKSAGIVALLLKYGAWVSENVDFTTYFGGAGNLYNYVKNDAAALKAYDEGAKKRDTLPEVNVIHAYDESKRKLSMEELTLKTLNEDDVTGKTTSGTSNESNENVEAPKAKKSKPKSKPSGGRYYIKFQAYVFFNFFMIFIATFLAAIITMGDKKDLGMICLVVCILSGIISLITALPTIIITAKNHAPFFSVFFNFLLDGMIIYIAVLCFMSLIGIIVGIPLMAVSSGRHTEYLMDDGELKEFEVDDYNNVYDSRGNKIGTKGQDDGT